MHSIKLLILILLCTACNQDYQEPTFLGVSQVTVSKITGSEAQLKGVAHFHNPNNQKLTLKEVDIDIVMNDRVIGHIDHLLSTKIPSNSDFDVPLNASFSMKDVGLINGLLSILGGKAIKVTYRGSLKVSYFGYPQTVPVTYETEVRI